MYKPFFLALKTKIGEVRNNLLAIWNSSNKVDFKWSLGIELENATKILVPGRGAITFDCEPKVLCFPIFSNTFWQG